MLIHFSSKAQIANQIVEKGQGNPYMIEELTTSLRDSGKFF
jgi:hypothetical protein